MDTQLDDKALENSLAEGLAELVPENKPVSQEEFAEVVDGALEAVGGRLLFKIEIGGEGERQHVAAASVGEGEKRFNVLHAEFFGDDHELDAGRIEDAVRERMLWGRELALGSVKPPKRALSLTYCGHTPVREVRQIGSHMFIDTGAFIAEGRLTMVEALTPRRWSVSTLDARAAGSPAFALP